MSRGTSVKNDDEAAGDCDEDEVEPIVHVTIASLLERQARHIEKGAHLAVELWEPHKPQWISEFKFHIVE